MTADTEDEADLYTAAELAAEVERAARLGMAIGRREERARVHKAAPWSEEAHPRGDDGRFVGAGDLRDARGDPAKAERLRATVTNPAERAKLDAALASKGPTPAATRGGAKVQFHFDGGQELVRRHRRQLVDLVRRYRAGQYTVDDLKDDVRAVTEKYIGEVRNHYRHARDQARLVAKDRYGEAALNSPEWEAVEEAFAGEYRGAAYDARKLRDLLRDHLDEHGKRLVPDADGDLAEEDDPRHADWFMRRDEHQTDAVEGMLAAMERGHAEGQHRIWDAAEAFLRAHHDFDREPRADLFALFKAAPWREEQHPRDHGKFSKAPGAGKGGDDKPAPPVTHKDLSDEQKDVLAELSRLFPDGVHHLLDAHGRVDEERVLGRAPHETTAHHKGRSEKARAEWHAANDAIEALRPGAARIEAVAGADEELAGRINAALFDGAPFASIAHGDEFRAGEADDIADALDAIGESLAAAEDTYAASHDAPPAVDDYVADEPSADPEEHGDYEAMADAHEKEAEEHKGRLEELTQALAGAREAAEAESARFRGEQREHMEAIGEACDAALQIPEADWHAANGRQELEQVKKLAAVVAELREALGGAPEAKARPTAAAELARAVLAEAAEPAPGAGA